MTPQAGQTLSHYRLVEKIGEGGMGVVYKALDTRLNRHVAIKVLPAELTSDPARRERLVREARAAAAVSHPNIATIHEIGEAGGVLFLAMELVEGRTLRRLLRERALSVPQALRVAAEMAEGLARAHQARVIHRDLKPENVILGTDGRVRILDFGLAKLLEEREEASLSRLTQLETRQRELTGDRTLLGTAAYMSPEQARGEGADARSDIFAFGVILYEMTTGTVPFRGRSLVETLGAILHDRPVPASRLNPQLPARLEELITKCLEKDPAERYQHTDDLLVDLRRIEHLTQTPVQPSPGLGPSRRRRRTWLIALCGLALAASLAVLWSTRVALRPALEPRTTRVALLRPSYEGPGEKAYLADVLPLVLAEGLRGFADLDVVPFASSRNFEPSEDARLVAQRLGVDWVIGGQMRIEGQRFSATLRTTAARGGRRVWSGRLAGGLSALLPRADRVVGEIATALGARHAASSMSRTRRDPRALGHYLKGRAFLEGWDVEKNYARAEKALAKAIAIDGEFAEAHAMLALAHLTHYTETGQPVQIQRAQAAAERALALAPDLPEAHMALGTLQLARGLSAEAARSFRRGIQLAPADDALRVGIARAYAGLGRDDEAEGFYRRAIELRPGAWYNHNALGVFYYERARLDRAKEEFRQVIQLHPGADTGYVNLATVHILAGEHQQAAPLLQAALGINPSHQARNNLGFVYYATGSFEEAARQWRAATEEGVQNPTLYSNLGDAYRQLGRSAEARSAYARAIELAEAGLEINPDDIETRGILCIALAGTGRCEEVRTHTHVAREAARGNPITAYYLAVASAICGDREAAIRNAVHAIEGGVTADMRTNPDLAPVLDHPAIRPLLDQAPADAR